MSSLEDYRLGELVVELDEANYAQPTVDAIHSLGKEMIAAGLTDVAKKLRDLRTAFAAKPV
ncbi:hypothetical protein FSB08_32375 [Paraburkholderia sp. JPY432]|uniref:hypothetical protein n=1 Tax=Paraburkholderia youngii TaxID=2782701 RepID=UPI0015962F51|nr:hypothetical protein [Paraburkholderia youngii]NVH77089.1 hypothetical protein [Paraburkholderia youngii]